MSRLFYSSHKNRVEPEQKKFNKYISFQVGKETFAADILKIHEILSYQELTKIPSLPPLFEGVLDHKNSVVPVLDLRKKFGVEITEYSKFNVIIILDVGGRMIGTLVDSVKDVITIAQEDIQPPPRITAGLRSDFIKGMIRNEEQRFIIVLNMDKMLDEKELLNIDKVEL
ncbi:purine-binding chemotaxis protein CheW [bacterium]|nr:purine-binding chemotaxis protein CheW [bacterium]